MIDADAIEAIRHNVRLSSVVSQTVKLKRSGASWVGLCPFHAERSPSFYVSDSKGLYHCKGCGAGGDIISYVKALNGWSFVEAVEALAPEAGVTIARSPEEQRADTQRLSDMAVIDRVRLWFQAQLQRCSDAVGYLKSRGISDEQTSAYGIGYAPPDPVPVQSLAGGHDDGLVSRTGLGLAAFRNRLVFPIRDRRGRTVGFGGRALHNEPPKYLNTPETDLFKKGNCLFGVDLVQPGPLYVVEGYVDVIACRSFGLSAVAPMGATLSETQLRNLWRISDSPILCFDGDEAGRKATRRALELAFRHLVPGLTLQTVTLPSGRDPGSYLGSGTGDGFKRALGRPVALSEAFWEASTSGLTLSGPDRLARLERDMIDVLRTIPDRQLRDKYVWDCKQRVRLIARPRPVIRANGHSFHSTNPATKRLLNAPGMSIKEALSIASMQAEGDALDEARMVLEGVGLWPIGESPSSSPKESG